VCVSNSSGSGGVHAHLSELKSLRMTHGRWNMSYFFSVLAGFPFADSVTAAETRVISANCF
jgi:hypothetical protein